MNRFLKPVVVAVFCATLLSSCVIVNLLFGKTELTITNNSGVDLEFVEWNGVSFSIPGSVYEPVLGYNVGGIAVGQSSTEEVEAGSDYIYFEVPADSTDLRTQDLVTVASHDQVSFQFIGTTIITSASVVVRTESASGAISERIIPLVPAEETRLLKLERSR